MNPMMQKSGIVNRGYEKKHKEDVDENSKLGDGMNGNGNNNQNTYYAKRDTNVFNVIDYYDNHKNDDDDDAPDDDDDAKTIMIRMMMMMMMIRTKMRY